MASSASFLEPVPERQRGPAVVLVVRGDDLPLLGGGLGAPVLERGLEGDEVPRRLAEIHLPGVSAQRLQPLDRIALHPGPDALPHDPVEVDEHAEPEQAVDFVLAGGEAAHQPAHGLLAGFVQLGEMIDRGRLVVVVVVHVQARRTLPALGNEVDQFLKCALLVLTVERPDLGVPGRAVLVRVGRVHDAEQVLQPELPVILAVVARPLDVEEQVARRWFRQRQQAPVRDQQVLGVALGIQDLVPDNALVLARHLQLRL